MLRYSSLLGAVLFFLALLAYRLFFYEAPAEGPSLLNFILAITGGAALFLSARFFLRRQMAGEKKSLGRQLILTGIALGILVVIILTLPVPRDADLSVRKEILGIIGIILGAAITLSSTTFLGNALAGIMLRIMDKFRPGDYLRVKEYSGRVTERGFFHVEIQTEEQGLLTTLPNLFVATNAVEVIPSQNIIISSEVSLGYDVSRHSIEEALEKAAGDASLEKPFVFITHLGDFAVTYRVHGVLPESKDKNLHILSARYRLNAKVLDALHEAGIEVVSPAFMNQRQVDEVTFIPKKEKATPEQEEEKSAEEIIFNKAVQAESIEKKKEQLEELNQTIEELENQVKSASAEEKEKLKNRLRRTREFQDKIKTQIEEEKEKL